MSRSLLLKRDGHREPTVQSARASVVADNYGQRDYLLRRLLAVADCLAFVAGLVAAAVVTPIGPPDPAYVFYGLLVLPVWPVLFKLYGLYDRDVKRISHTTVDDLPWLVHALAFGSVLTWLFFKLLPIDQLVLAQVVAFVATTLAVTLVLRAVVRGVLARMLGPEKVLLVGREPADSLLIKKMQLNPAYGLQPVGLLTNSADDSASNGNGLPTLGRLDDLAEVVMRYKVERVIIAHSQFANEQFELLDIVHRCKELSIKVGILPQLYDVMGHSVEVDDVEGLTVLGINPPVLSRSSRLMKRTMDLFGATVTLAVLAPLMTLVAVAIKLSSKGPVFFTQSRIGRGGKEFKLIKFRTMRKDAEELRQELLDQSEDPNWLKIDSDPRVTRLGRLLRHTSLDELPQLWNVVRGQMSLVGPRPLIEVEDRQVVGWARSRLDLTPGLTGLWQVLGRTNIPFAEMVKLDYLYVTNWTLWTDIRLILRTLPALVKRRGVN